MLSYRETSRFKKDIKKVTSQGKDYEKFRAVFRSLLMQELLDPKLEDHPLQGSWKGHRELHLEPDWLLIYRIKSDTLILRRTGSHADLF